MRGSAAPRMQRFSGARIGRQRFAYGRIGHATRMGMRSQRFAGRTARMGRSHVSTRMAARHALRGRAQTRLAARSRVQHAQNSRIAMARQSRNAMALNRANGRTAQNALAMRQSNRLNIGQAGMRQQANGATQTLLAQRRGLTANSVANANAFGSSRFAALAQGQQGRVIDPAQAARFVGQPVSAVSGTVALAALPASVSYLYPDTPAYYYQYGGGYLYQIDRSTSLIAALIPLLAGGFLPGTYLPQPYMASFVPAYWGLDSFYPAYFGATCNRYAYGVIYQVDCGTGLVEDVVPLYAGGYGVGEMLPSAYSYYNVPIQYRGLYYPTADYSYWYAPGAIYQYDPRSSLITSVAALMSPGFTIGRPLPAGYGMYNVPLAYRSTYFDSPAAWYRYNDGYIYRVDPTTMLVTGIAASLLT